MRIQNQKTWPLIFAMLWLFRLLTTLFFSEPYESNDAIINYIPMAHNLWQGNGFSYDQSLPFTPTACRLPGYPFFLAIFYSPWPSQPWIAITVQLLLEGAAVLFLYRTLKKHFPNIWVSRATTFFYLTWPYTLLFSGRFYRQGVFVPLLVFALGFFIRAVEKKSLREFTVSCIFFCLSIYFRYDGLYYFILFFLVWLWLQRSSLRRCALSIFILTGTLILFLMPWALRNYLVFEKWIPLNTNSFSYFWVVGVIGEWMGGYLPQQNLLPLIKPEDGVVLLKHHKALVNAWAYHGHPDYFLMHYPIFWDFILRYIREYPFEYIWIVIQNFFRVVMSSRIDQLPLYPTGLLTKLTSSAYHFFLYVFAVIGFLKSKNYRWFAGLCLAPALIIASMGNLKGRYELSVFPILFFGNGLCFAYFGQIFEEKGFRRQFVKIFHQNSGNQS